ncbi:hypothetical protein, partial [Heyndrickxia coagulans]|uniref:hypothetical protein n=1 Tax=Heyndrickxia coagulans TaxID=1398 RepID=UPI001C6578CD
FRYTGRVPIGGLVCGTYKIEENQFKTIQYGSHFFAIAPKINDFPSVLKPGECGPACEIDERKLHIIRFL